MGISKKRLQNIADGLAELYPDAECELNFESPLELLFATVMSAQCTDVAVNKVTPGLFAKYPAVDAYAEADVSEVEDCIRSIGLYRNKAKNIIKAAQMIRDDFDGEVPRTIEELATLPGVGRKTANCVLVNAFDLPGIMCDTHCIRLSNRMGLVDEITDPVKLEFALKKILPEAEWGVFSHRIILHGRRVCNARKPNCGECTIKAYCTFGKKQK
jgi:endonuclease-3